MKKFVFLALIFVPLLLNAQTSNENGVDSFLGALVVIGICIILFLASRQLVLYYWKVEIIIDNQRKGNALMERNNNLLQEQVELLRSQIEVAMVTSQKQD